MDIYYLSVYTILDILNYKGIVMIYDDVLQATIKLKSNNIHFMTTMGLMPSVDITIALPYPTTIDKIKEDIHKILENIEPFPLDNIGPMQEHANVAEAVLKKLMADGVDKLSISTKYSSPYGFSTVNTKDIMLEITVEELAYTPSQDKAISLAIAAE